MRRLNSFDLEMAEFQDGRFRFLVRRDSNDKSIVDEVLVSDCYGLKEHADRPFKRILDLGGHIGGFASWAASIWPDARIVSFEPLLNNQKLHQINTGMHKNVCLIPAAVTAKPMSRVEFVATDHDSQSGGNHNSGAGRLVHGSLPPDPRNEKILVEAMSIADVWRAFGPFDFVKMDIEDAEFDILHAMHDEGILDSIPFIRGEFHRKNFLDLMRPLFKSHEFGGYYFYENMGYFYSNLHVESP